MSMAKKVFPQGLWEVRVERTAEGFVRRVSYGENGQLKRVKQVFSSVDDMKKSPIADTHAELVNSLPE
jgi:hypothetical protein